jgi:uncharacterized membrane protein
VSEGSRRDRARAQDVDVQRRSVPAPAAVDAIDGLTSVAPNGGAALAPAVEERLRSSHREYESYQGPIPHPEHLAAFAGIDPTLVGRLVTMAEKQQHHRQTLEGHVVRWDTYLAVVGQVLGFFAVVASLAVVAWGYHLGHPAAATALGTSVIVALAGAFLYRQYRTGEGSKSSPPASLPPPQAPGRPQGTPPGLPARSKKRGR